MFLCLAGYAAVGRAVAPILNTGILGHSILRDSCVSDRENEFEFPRGSNNAYLNMSLWIGGVVDGDTLVTTNFDRIRGSSGLIFEMFPVQNFEERTTREELQIGGVCPPLTFNEHAVSEHDGRAR